jgi:hypothetical protein
MSSIFHSTIEQVDNYLKKWVQNIINVDQITFNTPSTIDSGTKINVYLFKITPSNIRDSLSISPIQVMLHYFISVWSDDIRKEHSTLTTLIFEALKNTDLSVDFPESNDLFNNLGIGIRPGFIVTIPIIQMKDMPKDALVKEPPSIKIAPKRTI